MWRWLKYPLTWATLPIWPSHLFIFFPKPLLFTTFFWLYCPCDKHKNKPMWLSFFFIFRRLKKNVICFFNRQHFSKQHHAVIWSKIITILCIKMRRKKNKHSKWKSCWVKSISATKSIRYQWKALCFIIYLWYVVIYCIFHIILDIF